MNQIEESSKQANDIIVPREFIMRLGFSPSAIINKNLQDFDGEDELKQMKYNHFQKRRTCNPLHRDHIQAGRGECSEKEKKIQIAK